MKAEPIREVSVKPVILTADELVRRFLPDVYAYVRRRLPVEQDAEDVTAETFQAALQSLKRQPGTDPRLWPWVSQIVKLSTHIAVKSAGESNR